MRILHLSSLYPPRQFGGAEKVASMLAEAQAAAGHEVAAAFLTPTPEPEGARAGVTTLPLARRNPLWIEDVSRRPAPVRMANKAVTLFNIGVAASVADVTAKFKPDIVHSHSMVELTPMVWRAARHGGARIVHTLHDYDILCVRAALFHHGARCVQRHSACVAASAWKRRFENDLDVVVAISGAVMQTHRQYGCFANFSEDRLKVIWNPMAPVPSADRRALSRDFTFGFMGRLVEEKGLGVLLDACRRLPPSGWRLRVAGRSAGTDWAARAEGLPIEFVGHVEPNAFLASLDVLVVPPVWAEPFGLTLIEAFAAGVPVLASDAGATRELAACQGQAWTVPAGDADALAQAMARILTAGREGLPGPATFRPVLEQVEPSRIHSAYLDAYHHALERKPSADDLLTRAH